VGTKFASERNPSNQTAWIIKTTQVEIVSQEMEEDQDDENEEGAAAVMEAQAAKRLAEANRSVFEFSDDAVDPENFSTAKSKSSKKSKDASTSNTNHTVLIDCRDLHSCIK
jgi:hypothetical protein